MSDRGGSSIDQPDLAELDVEAVVLEDRVARPRALSEHRLGFLVQVLDVSAVESDPNSRAIGLDFQAVPLAGGPGCVGLGGTNVVDGPG